MPIYEYRCSSCGSEHEVLQKFTEPPLAICPSCEKETLTKLVSAAGFQLKGSGWYATDFKNNNKPAAKKEVNGKAEKGTETKSDGAAASADNKSETKSEAAASPSCGTNCGCH